MGFKSRYRLRSKREVGPQNNQRCLDWQLPLGRSVLFPQVMQVHPFRWGWRGASTGGGGWGGKTSSTGKEGLSECRGSVSSASSGTSYVSPCQPARPHSIPVNAPIWQWTPLVQVRVTNKISHHRMMPRGIINRPVDAVFTVSKTKKNWISESLLKVDEICV